MLIPSSHDNRAPNPSQMFSNKWAWVFALLSLLYLVGAFYFVVTVKGLSTVLELQPATIEAALVDLSVIALPLVGAIVLYVHKLDQVRAIVRREFILNHETSTFVKVSGNPSCIYRISGPQVQIMWNADGEETDGPLYPLPPPSKLTPLDRDRFIADGSP